ncbi:tensin-3-like isoform X2 [Harmonia axyridis]|uniref:tensin-3-like isoform X2 n=1 Tax=Harmonia axyridis TaxID=115357 RepID=UPI001E276579|nr:tensin-3-like isoform X2 [Harmonia axyridis]XP_045468438.1 tensin-3-like isoform X2 [Harmonia axyridis]
MPEEFLKALAGIQYMGTFAVLNFDQLAQSQLLLAQIDHMKRTPRGKSILLVVSLAGIKVCSPDSKVVYMAHALRRISYATCDPLRRLFCFLAREPKGHFSLQYCHSFLTTSSEQAEELNTIVGNAFRMAYAAQLQKQPSFQDVISQQLEQSQTEKVLWTKELSSALTQDKSMQHQNQNSSSQSDDMDVQMSETATLRISPPSSIPGLKPHMHRYNVLGPSEKSVSTQSTPNSEESNSPTEMNSYKKMMEKPPLIKRIAMGLTGTLSSVDDDNCPLVSDNNSNASTPGSPTNRPLSGGYVNETNDADNKNLHTKTTVENAKNDKEIHKHLEMMDNCRLLQGSPASLDHDYKTRRFFLHSSSSSSSCTQITENGTLLNFMPVVPPPPERTDSLNNKEQEELRMAPWFQAGIPREIALEILAQEPIGTFMVRESTSKPGCFALSLRVPRNFQPTGIAHYLIVRTNKGYKIQGFTKEFTTLTSLITHHSVMPELLPCPLSLSRYNPSFAKQDSKKDFADIDLDPDYNTLADFRKMMADLNV